jgi:hypothetical protein
MACRGGNKGVQVGDSYPSASTDMDGAKGTLLHELIQV